MNKSSSSDTMSSKKHITSISRLILLHWVLIPFVLIIPIKHFEVNPIGMTILTAVILLPIIIHPISTLSYENNRLIVTKRRALFFKSTRSVDVSEAGQVYKYKTPIALSDGGWVLHGNFVQSFWTHLIFGYLFYQPTLELTIFNTERDQIFFEPLTINVHSVNWLSEVGEVIEGVDIHHVL